MTTVATRESRAREQRLKREAADGNKTLGEKREALNADAAVKLGHCGESCLVLLYRPVLLS